MTTLLFPTTDEPLLKAPEEPPASNSGMAQFSRSGDLVVKTGTHKLVFPFDATIVGCQLALGTSPTGTAAIADVNKNGTTIFTTQGNRPQVAAADADGVGSVATPDVTGFLTGDYMTVDIDQIGSGTPGADMVLTVEFTV